MAFSIPPYLREAGVRLEQQVGKEVADQFKVLMYRVIINVCPTNKEFSAAHRRLITSHGEEVYEHVGEYRRIQYMNAAVLRLWRAVHSLTVAEDAFTRTKQAADYYMVNESDLKDLMRYWKSIGSPDLTNRLTPKDDRQVWDQVTPDKLEISAEADQKITLRARRLVNEPDYRYLTQYGYEAFEHLVSDIRAYGLIRMQVQDWLPEIDRYQEAYAFMRSHLCKMAVYFTSARRARATKHVDPVTGAVRFKNTVTSIESLQQDGDGLHPLEMLNPEGTGNTVEEEVAGDLLQNRLLHSQEFNESERRILAAMFGKTQDAEINDMMEGAEVHDWMPWLCRNLGVDFKELTAKVVRLTGIKPKQPERADKWANRNAAGVAM